MALALDIVAGFFLLSGSLVLVTSAVGIVRLPNFFTRLHAASVNETFGPGLLLLGLALEAWGDIEVMVKVALVLVFLVLTGPVASHSLAKAALENGVMPGEMRRRKGERSSTRS
ncbi:MAG: monovalent cation/H(+) antiporter subunit G [Holophagales bacterium]|nr:monovalent cation/H(+) antiporter subunit G [Holophagales bacterium]